MGLADTGACAPARDDTVAIGAAHDDAPHPLPPPRQHRAGPGAAAPADLSAHHDALQPAEAMGAAGTAAFGSETDDSTGPARATPSAGHHAGLEAVMGFVGWLLAMAVMVLLFHQWWYVWMPLAIAIGWALGESQRDT